MEGETDHWGAPVSEHTHLLPAHSPLPPPQSPASQGPQADSQPFRSPKHVRGPECCFVGVGQGLLVLPASHVKASTDPGRVAVLVQGKGRWGSGM